MEAPAVLAKYLGGHWGPRYCLTAWYEDQYRRLRSINVSLANYTILRENAAISIGWEFCEFTIQLPPPPFDSLRSLMAGHSPELVEGQAIF